MILAEKTLQCLIKGRFPVVLQLRIIVPIRENANEIWKWLSRFGKVPMKNKNGWNESFFYKNIIDRDCENVHNDYRVYATELINFLSALIASRVKKQFSKLGLYKHHSHKELMRYLSKAKMVRMGEEGKWKPCKRLSYIDNIVSTLGI